MMLDHPTRGMPPNASTSIGIDPPSSPLTFPCFVVISSSFNVHGKACEEPLAVHICICNLFTFSHADYFMLHAAQGTFSTPLRSCVAYSKYPVANHRGSVLFLRVRKCTLCNPLLPLPEPLSLPSLIVCRSCVPTATHFISLPAKEICPSSAYRLMGGHGLAISGGGGSVQDVACVVGL